MLVFNSTNLAFAELIEIPDITHWGGSKKIYQTPPPLPRIEQFSSSVIIKDISPQKNLKSHSRKKKKQQSNPFYECYLVFELNQSLISLTVKTVAPAP